MECSISMRDCATRLVKAGYEVHGIDCEGHGKSSGLQGLVLSFDDLVDDLSEHFTNISERRENKKKMRIIMGESMGGAMALRLHRKKPQYWDGAILVAPMCKVRSNPYTHKGRPRLQTSHQLYLASLDLEKRLHEVSLPFIVLHGEDDKVTDPSVSKLLYESACTIDKTLKLYPRMWHSLSYGELPENLDIVFSDILEWLERRVFAYDAKLEEHKKLANDRDVSKN
ncbi:alpha/beta-Hydrolases superfamily protein [Striga hermonthica]|uniref:Alpha/beta-Hydrolases superfamily protein n=1 Tax=Striga hermonthica TaxID=68872 RepID=A0A9N7MY81_STRHE|nr:alpha/beta-Hydrolases superfamily protein [Striga hermonthica]